jgi:hypothetical protein
MHHRPHFTELSAQSLLQGVRRSGVGLVDSDFVDQ